MRLLHTMLRVENLQKSIDFYTQVLGMRLLRQQDYPSGKFTLAFLGYGNEADSTVIELTYNWGHAQYNQGDAFGHLAIGVQSIEQTCQLARNFGAIISREPGPMNAGTTILAFIQDPDGYEIELLERT